MRGCRIKCFGVGDGAACGDRNHSSYLYTFPEAVLLLDCGEPVSRSFKASGLSYDSIDRVLISHLHFDHIGGLFMLLQGFWLESRRKELVIHMPAEGIGAVRELLRAAYLFEELLPFPLTFVSWAAGRSVNISGAVVTPYPTTHLQAFRDTFGSKYPRGYEAFCFLLEAGGVRIGHSADIGAVNDLDPLFEKPLNLLVCELAHVHPEEIFIHLRDRRIAQIAFTHLGRPFWEKLPETKMLAERLLPGVPVTFLTDHQELNA